MEIFQRTYVIIFPTWYIFSFRKIYLAARFHQESGNVENCSQYPCQRIILWEKYLKKLGTYPCSEFCFLVETILQVCMIMPYSGKCVQHLNFTLRFSSNNNRQF
ncbi:hypothetical protein Tsubulata_011843, partial [Turnera subulata]